MREKQLTVLDHVKNIEVPRSSLEKPTNEYWALCYLWEGMEFLYHQVIHYEQKNQNPEYREFIFGSSPKLANTPKKLIQSAFHWYAMSAYQYALVVGAIAYTYDNNNPLPNIYAEQTIPNILTFRDKIAAHFAWAKNHNKDTPADKLASIIPQLALIDGRFYIGIWQVTRAQSGNQSKSEIVPWSITETHEELRKRYHPVTFD